MNLSSGIILYALIWIIALFMVLPWGVTISEKAEEWFASSAPDKPLIGLKILLACAIAGFLWIGAYYIITGDFINFRE